MPTHRYELKISKTMTKELKKQYDFLVENGERLYTNVFARYYSQYKTLDGIEKGFDSLDSFFQSMGLYNFIELIRDDLEKVVVNGYKESYHKQKVSLSEIGIDFSLSNPLVAEYMNNFESIQLSDAKGSIPFTTKNQVIRVLREGVNNNLAYGEVAKKITELDSTLFSKDRAKLIAVRETGQAYEWGNYIPMHEAKKQGAKVEKKRLTVNDSRVTKSCMRNQNEGRVGIDHTWQSGDDLPPRDSNPKCRCTAQRRIN